MGGPHGQKYVWAMAHTAHTVPVPMAAWAGLLPVFRMHNLLVVFDANNHEAN